MPEVPAPAVQNLQVTDIFTAGPVLGNRFYAGPQWCGKRFRRLRHFLEVGEQKKMIEGEKDAEDTKVVLWSSHKYTHMAHIYMFLFLFLVGALATMAADGPDFCQFQECVILISCLLLWILLPTRNFVKFSYFVSLLTITAMVQWFMYKRY